MKTDVWAIGCILYELCSLKKAFDGGNLGAITVKVMRCHPFFFQIEAIDKPNTVLAP